MDQIYIPTFTITNKILRYIGHIDAAKEIIDKAPLLPYYEKKFQNEALVRTVHYGTHIEGNELSFNQAEKVLQGIDVPARERDIQEIINYRSVIEYIGEKQIDGGSTISLSQLSRLHKITIAKLLPEDQCGIYRQGQVVIKNSHSGEVVFRPPTADKIIPQLANLIAFINREEYKDIHPVLRSGIVHYEFVRIHPFVDGNGRVARALSTLLLFQEGYDIRKFFSLEEYFDSNPLEYYKALQSVAANDGILTYWLEYFTQGLANELTKIRDKVESVSIDANLREKLGGKPLLLNERQLQIIEYIQKTGYLENKIFHQLFPMVSEDTVLNELKELIRGGIIKKHGVTKGVKYIMAK